MIRWRHRRLDVGVMVAAVSAAGCTAPPGGVVPASAVRPGIEVLLGDSAHLVAGRRVGLVTNQGGVDRAGVHAVDRILAAGVRLVALFSPEHGFRGAAAPGEAVASTLDSATGLPIYSLYGRTVAPTDSMLAGLDILLVDLPDVGARYFTYLSTTIEVMRAAARRGLPVVVLDRPNPIGGVVQGNVLDSAHRSFIGALATPMRPGLTLGELARLARQELGLATDLRVVPVTGWRRRLALDQAGLPFVPPSPNLRDLEALFHYPGSCLFEGTALSVGRGTDAPYRQIGAPWLDAVRVIREAGSQGLPGVRLEPVRFRPERPADRKFDGVEVAGIRLVLTNREAYDPTRTAVVLLAVIQRLYPDRIGWIARHFDRLGGGPALREAIVAGRDPDAIVSDWVPAREAWERTRTPALLYPAR